MKTRAIIALIAVVTIITLLTGCGDGIKLKQQVQEALGKQAEINNYSFMGSVDLQLETMASTRLSDPTTSMLLTLLTHSHITWNGVASADPVRLEVVFHITPRGSSQTLDLPILIKDNKMYVSIPMINEKDEYFMIDMARLAELSNQENPLSVLGLNNVGQFTAMALEQISDQFDSKSYKKQGDAISVMFNSHNTKDAVISLVNHLPQWFDDLQESGLLSDNQTAKLKDDIMRQSADKLAESIRFNDKDPGMLSFTIDSRGFLTEEHLKFNLSVGADDNARTYAVDYVNSRDKLNQSPPFTLDLPEQVLPFEHILELISVQP